MLQRKIMKKSLSSWSSNPTGTKIICQQNKNIAFCSACLLLLSSLVGWRFPMFSQDQIYYILKLDLKRIGFLIFTDRIQIRMYETLSIWVIEWMLEIGNSDGLSGSVEVAYHAGSNVVNYEGQSLVFEYFRILLIYHDLHKSMDRLQFKQSWPISHHWSSFSNDVPSSFQTITLTCIYWRYFKVSSVPADSSNPMKGYQQESFF